jgi:adenine deaminase
LPFEYLGELDRAGTIAVGKQSDLILVEANPLADVSGASKIAGVLVQGRWLDADLSPDELSVREDLETEGRSITRRDGRGLTVTMARYDRRLLAAAGACY